MALRSGPYRVRNCSHFTGKGRSKIKLCLDLKGWDRYGIETVLRNNACLYAAPEERETMDKKPSYRQSGVVLLLLSGVFAVNGLAIVLKNRKIEFLQSPLILGL